MKELYVEPCLLGYYLFGKWLGNGKQLLCFELVTLIVEYYCV